MDEKMYKTMMHSLDSSRQIFVWCIAGQMFLIGVNGWNISRGMVVVGIVGMVINFAGLLLAIGALRKNRRQKLKVISDRDLLLDKHQQLLRLLNT